MYKYIVLLLLSSFILLLNPTYSQHGSVSYQDVGVLEDYSNPQCFALYQDPTGLLWMSNWA